MADKKISALPAATTPLAGTEVLPIVQGGTTDQVSVADITAGRAVSGASFNVTGSAPPTNGVYLPSANSFGVATANSLKLTVDPSGNVGLGTTPAAHGSSERSIDVGNTVSFGRGSSAELNVNFNTFINSSGQYIYRISTFASSYQQLTGEHKFFTAPSGTAGNVVPLTQRMTITQPGDITANTGNFVPATAGKGIDFSANTHAAGMTSELLTWYEEGVWTPTWSGGSVTVNQSRYTRIGRQVTWIFDLTFGASASGSDSDLTLPFTVGGGWGAGSINFTDISATVSVNIDGTANRLLLRSAINAGNISCATAATKRIIGIATYFV